LPSDNKSNLVEWQGVCVKLSSAFCKFKYEFHSGDVLTPTPSDDGKSAQGFESKGDDGRRMVLTEQSELARGAHRPPAFRMVIKTKGLLNLIVGPFASALGKSD
jgi:hypothetical protein